MTPKPNRKLHLVVPVEQGPVTAYVHSTPVDGDVFDTFFLPISKTFAAIYQEGLSVVSGPRVAAKMLKAVSTSLGIWESESGDPERIGLTVKGGLMAEIHRLTNVFVPTPENGWSMVPLDDAIRLGVLDAEDVDEVENALVFFTLAWLMHKRTDRQQVLEGAASLWGAQVTFSTCTAFRDSLPTSTAAASSGKSPA